MTKVKDVEITKYNLLTKSIFKVETMIYMHMSKKFCCII